MKQTNRDNFNENLERFNGKKANLKRNRNANRACTSKACDDDVVFVDIKKEPKTDSDEEFQPISKISKPLSLAELVEQINPPSSKNNSIERYSMNELALRCQIDVLHDILTDKNKIIESQENFIDRLLNEREECGDLLLQIANKLKTKPKKPYNKP
ncbi:unnamed protein product, partial [Brachionus calyciflorus]